MFFFQVSVSKARAVIVLASDENADQVVFLLYYLSVSGATLIFLGSSFICVSH